ncbi:C40 family peptidase [Streptomyces smaragdinus]|uniref:C40 family peptidase n=1 Tax=Streptomyces smaragdinus TaxID=2585196 RepID=UPI002B1FD1E1|nr:NlpC/P60 family protein [Streptomyces smaragdinus]
MASHRRPKAPNRTRVSILTAGAAAAVALTSQAAHAEPSKSEVKKKVDALYEQAEAATEKYNAAKDHQEKLTDQVEKIQDQVARGQEELNELRDGLGALAAAQYRGGGVDPSVQLFLSSDPDSYLDKASALDQLGTKQADALKQISAKQRTLTQQRQEAGQKLQDLEQTRTELGKRKAEVQKKLSAAQEVLNKLTAAERAELAEANAASRSTSRPDLGNAPASSSRASAALSFAASKVGLPYVYGATGPSSFDCSGLTSAAYASAGVGIPRTSQAQYSGAGTQISESQLAPGDLVFYYSDLHHVGMYAGNGQIVHASNPTTGITYAPLHSMPYMGAVRVG